MVASSGEKLRIKIMSVGNLESGSFTYIRPELESVGSGPNTPTKKPNWFSSRRAKCDTHTDNLRM